MYHLVHAEKRAKAIAMAGKELRGPMGQKLKDA